MFLKLVAAPLTDASHSAVHNGNKNYVAVAVHPGYVALPCLSHAAAAGLTRHSLVQTEMGNEGARAMGLEKAPVSLDDVVQRLLPFVSGTGGRRGTRYLRDTDWLIG